MTALHSPFAVRQFTTTDADALAATLKAIADPVRLRILALLAESGELTVTDLIPVLQLTQPTVSHHLKILGAAGLIDERQVGPERRRKVNVDAIRALAKVIDPWGGAR